MFQQVVDARTYPEKLADPRWQRRRLEIFERDQWRCRQCGDHQTTLNVHHLWYEGEPWDAPDDALLTLCQPCHDEETKGRAEAERQLLFSLRRAGLLVNDLFHFYRWLDDRKNRERLASIQFHKLVG